MTWTVWIIAAVVLAVGEMLTLSFFLAPFAAGALLAALVSAVGGGLIASWAIFAITSLLLLLVVRPIARAHRRQPAQLRTGTAALVGGRGPWSSASSTSRPSGRSGSTTARCGRRGPTTRTASSTSASVWRS